MEPTVRVPSLMMTVPTARLPVSESVSYPMRSAVTVSALAPLPSPSVKVP